MTDNHSSSTGLRTAIVYTSVHHGNTRRIAEVMASEMKADLFTADDAAAVDLSGYDLVGLGSGIYFGRHHRSLRQIVGAWNSPPKRTFLFSTAGLPFLHFLQHASLRGRLRKQTCEIVGDFCCRLHAH
ncbi:MAG: flavodoxin [Fuerstiella sp.]|nr:flavodoxin [Fuerstiella sp.]MCP4853100.1 flavodoxin [Fuerstiella sp.]